MAADVKPHPKFAGIYVITMEDGKEKLATRNLIPGRSVYGERLVSWQGVEYRTWDPFRSKLAAAILKNLKTVPIEPGHRVLYLGAASGTTTSHISDIVGLEGQVICVEFSARSIRELVNNVSASRPNMMPLLEDARLPQHYAMFVGDAVDDIYCDIAQPEQAKILADNADMFLRKEGSVMLAVKSQSIDVTREPSEVYKDEMKILKARCFRIEDVVNLEPFEKAHAMVVAKFA